MHFKPFSIKKSMGNLKKFPPSPSNGKFSIFLKPCLAWLAVVSYGEWVAIVSISTSLTVSSFIPMWTSITGVLLRCQRILVIVNGGDGAGGTEVVGWNIKRTLAWLAVIGSAQLSIAIESLGTGVTLVSHSVVFTSSTLQSDRVTGCGVTTAVTLSAGASVQSVVDSSESIVTRLTTEASVSWGQEPFLGLRTINSTISNTLVL